MKGDVVKRILLLAAIVAVLTFAGQAAFAQAAHADVQCQPAGAAADSVSSQQGSLATQQNENATPADLIAVEGPVEESHGGRIPHCGDSCDVEGAGGGCVYYGSNGFLVRTTARCQNGVWTPYP